jgi:hypothetical protein
MELSFNPNEPGLDVPELAYRDRLGDGIETLLDEGADTLAEMVAGLNRLGVADPTGAAWTDASLTAELRRLAW